jgi:DNA-directed RNA polymerase beta' subunit
MRLCKSVVIYFIIGAAILCMSCAPQMNRLSKATWFNRGQLQKSTIVIFPAFLYDEETKNLDIDNLFETVLRNQLKDATVLGAFAARTVLDKEGVDSVFQTFLRNFTSIEFLDTTLFREFSPVWEEQWNASYALIPEVKQIYHYQSTGPETNMFKEEKESESEKRISGVRATLRVSFVRIPDGALAWLGEGSNKKESVYTKTKEKKEEEGDTSIIGRIASGVVSTIVGDSEEPEEPEESEYPPYPTIEAAIEKTFIGILENLPKE